MRILVCLRRAGGAAALGFFPLILHAQTLPPLSVPRPPGLECQDALAASARATAAMPLDSLKFLLIRISPCHPEFGRAVALLMRAFATGGTDEQVSLAYAFTEPMVDSAAFAAARDVAASAISTELARGLALLTLFRYLDRERYPMYEEFARQVRGAVFCTPGSSSDVSRSGIAGDYTPLPSNAAAQSRAVAVAIQQEEGISPALQSASYCVLEAWRKVNALPSNAHWAFTTASLSVTYVCGNRFRIQNQHTLPIALQWQVGSLPRRTVLIAPRTSQDGERLLDAGLNGTLSVFLDGDVIFTTPNRDSRC
jgi:hypothetical protein